MWTFETGYAIIIDNRHTGENTEGRWVRMAGKLMVLEGTDGSGKSTQFRLLCQRLEREGVPFTEEGNVDLSRALWTGESHS